MAYDQNQNQEHAFKTFAKDLKGGEVAPVLYFYGAEEYLIEWAVKEIVKRCLPKDAAGMDLEEPDGDTVTPQEIISSCEMFSMFGSRRIVWVREAAALKSDNAAGYGEKGLEVIERYLKDPNASTILIFSSHEVKNDSKDKKEKKTKLNNLLLKYAKSYDFCPLDRKTLRAYIKKRLKEAGCAMSDADCDYLIDATGYYHRESEYRILDLNSDLDKIVALSDDTAGRAEIDEAVLGDMDTYIFDFLDYMSQNRKSDAFLLLSNMLSARRDVFSILGSLINQFELMTEVKELKENAYDLTAMSKELKVHEFRIRKSMTAGNRMSLERLKRILVDLYETDAAIKRGDIDGGVALELLVGRI
jgi:DNA polymerase-3 subunit delta